MQGAFELCGICGNALRPGVRFCGRCGAEQGLAVPRDAGAGREVREPAVRTRLHVGDAGLMVALVAYFAMLLPGIVLLARDELPTLRDLLWAELAIGVVAVVGMAWMWRDTLPLLRAPRVTGRDAAIAVGGIGVALAVAWTVSAILPDLFVGDTWLFELEGAGLGYALVHAAVVPAIVEELAFRGVVLTALTAVFRPAIAVAVSAMLFAILHLSPMAFPHLLVLGALLGAARVRTGSVWPCVAIHLVYNTIVIAAQW